MEAELRKRETGAEPGKKKGRHWMCFLSEAELRKKRTGTEPGKRRKEKTRTKTLNVFRCNFSEAELRKRGGDGTRKREGRTKKKGHKRKIKCIRLGEKWERYHGVIMEEKKRKKKKEAPI